MAASEQPAEASPVQRYVLSGGSQVSVLKPFGEAQYSAVVQQRDRYPTAGFVARNRGRQEYLYLLSGEVKVTLDGNQFELVVGAGILIGDGASYVLLGSGEVLVMVSDQTGGTTEILPEHP
jgi:mannose-6-phosphate isomerase-like protein (cupin superfamily)